MIPLRCSICRQRREVLLLARSLSESAAHEEVSLAELAGKLPPSSSATEPLFGIAPRKLRNIEDEDFVSRSTAPQLLHPSLAPKQNYFSQTWAEQKQEPLIKSSHPSDEQSDRGLVISSPSANVSLRQCISTQRSAPTRVWLAMPDLQASTQDTFTFASFKVLASGVAFRHRGHLYNDVPSWMLSWSSRRRKILTCLDLYSADIICLQEVDKFSDLESEFLRKGYDGLYKATSGTERYGCAVFWRKARFQLLHEESLEFSSLGMRDNVAQLCVLQSTVPGNPEFGTTAECQRKRLIVGNIDVLFNPKRGHIKLGQCRAFLQQAHQLSISWPGAPLIIGGCFHLTPQSAVYKFLANSQLDVHGLECQHLSGQVQVSAQPVRKGTKQLGGKSMTTSGEGELTVDLRERLRKTLTAKFASRQQTPALEFANSAKNVLSQTSGSGSFSTTISNNGYIYENEHRSTKELVSKTIEILEGCIKSPATNVTEVDAAPSISVSNEACRMSSTIAVPAGTSPADASKAHVCLHSSAELSGHSSPDHGWDPEDLKVATGSADSTMVEHDLKLFSVYPEIQGNSSTRDVKGEPLVTMCHNKFRGTVDYIWRSEGLKTAKVLDTFCIADMTPELPFMACGSDHIYLACELAFTS